eukprot:Blabericola_migrator_1__4712@NODE_2488_length_2690_cov_49_388868_g1559_i0_p1_GENE_NODE_2488_length_2690_cov_49_388868_g1559_i0NODE_2488_length_2690_cov_49_388868_g1559_i0_p1_ORF_typecomplete_len708_score97_01_NODE_2488_length_2690_cov_49_388868_g1559_i01702293
MNESSRFAVRVNARAEQKKAPSDWTMRLAPFVAMFHLSGPPARDDEGTAADSGIADENAPRHLRGYSTLDTRLVEPGSPSVSISDLVNDLQRSYASFKESYYDWNYEEQLEFATGNKAIKYLRNKAKSECEEYRKHPLIDWLTGAELHARVSFDSNSSHSLYPRILRAWLEVAETLFGPSFNSPEARDAIIQEILAFEATECPSSKRVADWLKGDLVLKFAEGLQKKRIRAANLIQCAIGELPLQYALWQLINGRPETADALVSAFESKLSTMTLPCERSVKSRSFEIQRIDGAAKPPPVPKRQIDPEQPVVPKPAARKPMVVKPSVVADILASHRKSPNAAALLELLEFLNGHTFHQCNIASEKDILKATSPLNDDHSPIIQDIRKVCNTLNVYIPQTIRDLERFLAYEPHRWNPDERAIAQKMLKEYGGDERSCLHHQQNASVELRSEGVMPQELFMEFLEEESIFDRQIILDKVARGASPGLKKRMLKLQAECDSLRKNFHNSLLYLLSIAGKIIHCSPKYFRLLIMLEEEAPAALRAYREKAAEPGTGRLAPQEVEEALNNIFIHFKPLRKAFDKVVFPMQAVSELLCEVVDCGDDCEHESGYHGLRLVDVLRVLREDYGYSTGPGSIHYLYDLHEELKKKRLVDYEFNTPWSSICLEALMRTEKGRKFAAQACSLTNDLNQHDKFLHQWHDLVDNIKARIHC